MAIAVCPVVVLPALVVGTVVMTTQNDLAAMAPSCGHATQQVGDQLWTSEQLTNAQTVVTVAVQRKLPRRAAVLALATAMVESGLRNLPTGDHDSLGLFQQRPSQGWGAADEVLNPTYAANAFYDRLLAVSGWQTMSPGIAEQQVQRSAFPGRYAPREATAAELVAKYWQGPDNPTSSAPGPNPAQQVSLSYGGCPDNGQSNLPLASDRDNKQLPPDFRPPADSRLSAAVTYVIAQLGKPYVWGATGPDAFDCSGLMQAAWAHAGVGISRTTSSQVHDGVAVGSLSSVKPGDLLFIPGADGTPVNPGHVGMYVGYGTVINAYDEKHGVITESLASWALKVVAIRRPLPSGGDGKT
ncbi:C40 family peptidase [Amycolatopsis rhizosphaerae]|uniref:C40 family peptidase n=1 Tax=Amycolatopsis rhizosphaerae TaxID=2053003 RepID=UPI001FEBC1F3|nr:C40 family peptidase [Amycolatopsis rhizosphaerae]